MHNFIYLLDLMMISHFLSFIAIQLYNFIGHAQPPSQGHHPQQHLPMRSPRHPALHEQNLHSLQLISHQFKRSQKQRKSAHAQNIKGKEAVPQRKRTQKSQHCEQRHQRNRKAHHQPQLHEGEARDRIKVGEQRKAKIISKEESRQCEGERVSTQVLNISFGIKSKGRKREIDLDRTLKIAETKRNSRYEVTHEREEKSLQRSVVLPNQNGYPQKTQGKRSVGFDDLGLQK